MVDIEKRCTHCKHGRIFGWHAVRIDCGIDGKSMCGYTGEDEYRLYAKDCEHFESNGRGAWSNELQKSIEEKDINWI